MSQYPPVLIAQNSYCILASSFYSSSTLHMRVKFIVLSSFSCHRGQLTNVADMALVLFCWQLVLVSVGNVFFFTCRWGTCLQCFFLFFFPHLSESRMSHTYREGAYPHFGFFLGFSLEIGHDSHGRVTLPNNKRPHEMRLGESFV